MPVTTIFVADQVLPASELNAAFAQCAAAADLAANTGAAMIGTASGQTLQAQLSALALAASAWGGVAGGTANALTLTPTPAITAYSAGQALRFKAQFTNTGAATANWSGLGALPILGPSGAPVGAGDIIAGEEYTQAYDPTTGSLINYSASALGGPDGAAQVGIVNTGSRWPGTNVQSVADNAAVDAGVVHLAGTETITGAKTFSASPQVPTPGPSDNSTSAASTAFVKTAISGFVGAIVYQGTWNASTNTPTLTSGSGTKGFLYKVSVAGSTTIDGISQWNVGDSIVFDGTVWDKIDGIASEVVSVAGRTGAVTLAVGDVSGAATDSAVVHLAGTETVTGAKTFSAALAMSGAPINEVQGSDIASAATVNLDTATGNYVHVTGTTPITAITLSQGRRRLVEFTGALTLTNGASLILPGGANITTAAGDVASFVGESGGVVRCSGYLVAAVAPGSASGRLLAVQVFTANGTYTPTPGANSAIVEMVAGGGSGGGAQATGPSAGSGGYCGGYIKFRWTSLSSQSITIGAGGTAATAGAGGSAGGNTVFGTVATVNGGPGGRLGTATAAPFLIVQTTALPTIPSSITNGTILATYARAGDPGMAASSTSFTSGSGASNPLGAGGLGVYQTASTTSSGNAGTGYGSGSSGGTAGSTSGASQAGQPGIVIVYEYS